MATYTAHRNADFIPVERVEGVFDLFVMEAAGGAAPTPTIYGNIVYDTSGATWVTWSSSGSPDTSGTSYPGPGTPPGDWKSGSYAYYNVS